MTEPKRILPVVVAGGGGTRLWPLSRQAYPKQFIALCDHQSLLQATLERVRGLDKGEIEILPPLLIGNEQHRFMVMRQARETGYEPETLVLEPEGRGTAAALTVAALAGQALHEDVVLLMLPADHLIRDEAAWRRAIMQAVSHAGEGQLVTFGIPPDRPATGYGYIEPGEPLVDTADIAHMRRFVEKPDSETATEYVSSGHYLWNSGQFMLPASLWLELIGRANPVILESCRAAWSAAQRDGAFLRLEAESFARCPNDSVDYAVMEQLNQYDDIHALVCRLDCGWSDVGSWDVVREVLGRDARGNAVRGDVMLQDVEDSLVYADERLVAVLSCRDLVVVETADAVLVADRERVQSVRDVVESLSEDDRDEYAFHRRVYRPWGEYEAVDQGERFKVKRITVEPGSRLSLQSHHQRAEHWVVVRGRARVTRDDEIFVLRENESTYIPAGTRHRLENPGPEPLEIIEVQSGDYLGEDDIQRFDDDFGRN